MDAFERLLLVQQRQIETLGWAVTGVVPTPDDPGAPFAYTVGLTEHDHADLVSCGCSGAPAVAAVSVGPGVLGWLEHGLATQPGGGMAVIRANAVARWVVGGGVGPA